MTAIIIDGKLVADKIYQDIETRITILKQKQITPGLATILLGSDPASEKYVKKKQKMCKKYGIYSRQITLNESISESYLKSIIHRLNYDKTIHGILIQLPLPKHINKYSALDAIFPCKDVDGFHKDNVANLWRGNNPIIPCTPKGILAMLDHYNIPIAKKNAVIVGRSMIVGTPMAAALMNKDATTTICHLGTKDLSYHTKQAEILIVAAGSPHLITEDMIQQDSTLIDVGINVIKDSSKKSGYSIVGDIHPDCKNKAKYLSPVPGGVGLTTIAALLDNTVLLAKKSISKRHKIYKSKP